MSEKAEWATVVVAGVQFAAGTALAWWALKKQHDDSIGQRESEWFHRVVVDKTITALHDLVERESTALENSAQRCSNALGAGAGGVPALPPASRDQIFRDEIQAFRSRIGPARQQITHYAFIFNVQLHNNVSAEFQSLEDQVAEWFDRLQANPALIPKPSLIEIVCTSERKLLDAFRRFEFVDLPRLHAETLASAKVGRRRWNPFRR